MAGPGHSCRGQAGVTYPVVVYNGESFIKSSCRNGGLHFYFVDCM